MRAWGEGVVSVRSEELLEDDRHLEHMSPILALVVQPFIEHLHDLHEIGPMQQGKSEVISLSLLLQQTSDALIVGELRELVHLRSTRTPWIVAGRLADLGLGIAVSFGIVLCCS